MKSSNASSIKMGRRYLGMLLSLQRSRTLQAFSLMVLISFLSRFGILVLLPLLQLVGVGDQPSKISEQVAGVFDWFGLARSLPNILIVFFVLVSGHTLLARWMSLVNIDVERSFSRSLENQLYSAFMQTDWLSFVRMRRSDLVHALTDNVRRVASGTMCLLGCLSALLVSAIHVVLSLLISPKLLVITLSFFLVFWFLLRPYNQAARQTGYALIKLSKRFYATVTEHLEGMKDAKSLGSEQRHIDLCASSTGALRDAFLRYARIRENTTLLYKIGSAGLLSVLLFVAVEIMSVPVVELILLIVIFARLLPRIQQIHTPYQEVIHMLPSFASLIDRLERCRAAREPQPIPSPRPLNFEHEIQVSNVDFSYQEGENRRVLKDLSLSIAAGSTTAIFGPSGAGKTTLGDLLIGLLTPDCGSISVEWTSALQWSSLSLASDRRIRVSGDFPDA